MGLNTVGEMRNSFGLQNRIMAAAAQKGVAQPETWVGYHLWRLVSTPEWVAAYEYAENGKNKNVNQDTGARDDVINDQMIEDAVDAIIEEEAPA